MSSALFAPLSVRGVQMRNRIWVSPLCQYSVERRDGVVTDWHLVHLGSFARGGAGLVMAEATGVVPEGRISGFDTGIWNDDQRDAWSRVVAFLHSQGAKAGIQLAHAGRKASTRREWTGKGTEPIEEGGWPMVAPSALAFPGYDEPVALDEDGIANVVTAFGSAARRALDAGFDVLEVHAAHGYLLHQFLSPLSNLRTDAWGGDLAARARLVRTVVREVRRVAGESVPVFVRVSATDWSEPAGLTVDDVATVAGWLREDGADVIDTSSGGLITGVTIPTGPGYQVGLASTIKERSGMITTAVGQITESHQAEAIVAEGKADAVFVGRQFMRDPHLPLRWAHELAVDLDYWPKQYLRARWPHA